MRLSDLMHDDGYPRAPTEALMEEFRGRTLAEQARADALERRLAEAERELERLRRPG